MTGNTDDVRKGAWDGAGFATRAIHAGQDPDPATGAVVPPIHLSSTFRQDGVGVLPAGFEYSRSGNPTRQALQECLAALESGSGGPGAPARAFAFASGLGASSTLLMSVLNPGDHIVIPDDAYGGTYRLINQVLRRWRLEHTVAPIADPAAVAAATQPGRTKLIWAETPTNPMLRIADIQALAAVARECGALLVVDNTFATPYLQQPLGLGADIVVHSTTKYLGGHSDVVGGAVVLTDPQLAGRIEFHQNAIGSVPSPFDCWLVLRGIKTLEVRMQRHCASARRIAATLADHPGVTEVIFPGLPGHPGHELAAAQMRDFGGMISFRPHGGPPAARAICGATKIFTLGESLGGVESLIELPAVMTHASVAGSELAVPEDLIRLSVGIESVEDLEQDLLACLDAVRPT